MQNCLPKTSDAVRIEGCVAGDNRHTVDLGLGNQQTVERVFVVQGELLHGRDMYERNG